MSSQSRSSEPLPGDLVRLVPEMITFYSIYGPVDPGFLCGEPVIVLHAADNRALVRDANGNSYSTSIHKIEPV